MSSVPYFIFGIIAFALGIFLFLYLADQIAGRLHKITSGENTFEHWVNAVISFMLFLFLIALIP